MIERIFLKIMALFGLIPEDAKENKEIVNDKEIKLGVSYDRIDYQLLSEGKKTYIIQSIYYYEDEVKVVLLTSESRKEVWITRERALEIGFINPQALTDYCN